MPVPTLIIAWDDFGLKVEAPGANGQRVKIEGITFEDLPAAIQAELVAQRDRLANAPAPNLAPSIKDRPDPEVERQRRNEEAARERKLAYDLWFNSLTKQEQRIEEVKRKQREERNANRQAEMAKNIWYTTASRHGIKLANKVISDPKRRPRIAKTLKKNIGKIKIKL